MLKRLIRFIKGQDRVSLRTMEEVAGAFRAVNPL